MDKIHKQLMRLQKSLLRFKINYKSEVKIMSVKEQVLETMKSAGKPVSAGEVEKFSGLDRKEIDNAFKELKKENAIISPVRCKWEPVK
jgi:hypothetical protein